MAISLSGPMAEVTVSAAHEGLYGRAYLSVRPVKVIGVAQADHFRPCGGSAGPGPAMRCSINALLPGFGRKMGRKDILLFSRNIRFSNPDGIHGKAELVGKCKGGQV
jgi:hypothetical protein